MFLNRTFRNIVSRHHLSLYRPLSVTRGDSVIELHQVTSKLQDGRTLFEDVSISLLAQTIVGVVGPNGAGKSTFLKLLAGRETNYQGRISVRDGAKVTYLAQEPELDETLDVRGNVALGGGEAASLLKRFEEVNEALGTCEDETLETLLSEQSDLLVKLDECNAWDLDNRVDQAMAALSLPPPSAKIASLSGGEKRRVALCRALMEQPDVLLLDEPSNHLDALSVGWLETYLKDFKGAIVAVTHDRSLLEALCEWVVDIEYGKLYPYEGNYSQYLEQKGKLMDGQKTKEASLQKALARELEFIRSNKKSGGLARKKRYDELEASSKEAWSRSNEMTQGAIVLPPPKKRLGGSVMSAQSLSIKHPGRDKPLFENLSFRLEPGQIIGVVGKNGCGKTSLFNFIAKSCMGDGGVGLIDKDAVLKGEVEVGDSVSIGLVAQTRGDLDPTRTVFEEIGDGEDTLIFGDNVVPVRQYVASFGLKGAAQSKKVGVLSGGERNRVHLAKVLKRGHNVLLLDEPTNDLDITTLRALEDALNDFAGTAVVISHDRWFLDRVCTHTIAFEDIGEEMSSVEFFDGPFSEYRDALSRRNKSNKSSKFSDDSEEDSAIVSNNTYERQVKEPKAKSKSKKDKKKGGKRK